MNKHSLDLMFARLLKPIGLTHQRRGYEFYAETREDRASGSRTNSLSGITIGRDKVLVEGGEEIILLIKPRRPSLASRGYKFHTRDCLIIHGMRTKGLAANFETISRSENDIKDEIVRFGQPYSLCKHCLKLETKA